VLFDFNLYSSLLLVFFVHIVSYAFLFLKRAWITESYADRLMGIFMLLSAMLITPFYRFAPLLPIAGFGQTGLKIVQMENAVTIPNGSIGYF